MAIWKEALPDGNHVRLLFNRYDVPGHTEFAIGPEGNHIRGTCEDTIIEDAVSVLLGAVIACTLRIRGLLCLHASVIRVSNHAIAFVGHKGMGKSTTVAALAEHGYPIQADDIAVLTEAGPDWVVQSGEPRLRLWPSALAALETTGLATSPILSIDDKQVVRLHHHANERWQFHPSPLPLARIYILEPSQIERVQPSITPIAPTDALMELVQYLSVGSKLPLEPTQRAQEFTRLTNLARTVPVCRIEQGDDLAHLPKLREAVIADALDHIPG